MHTMLPALGLTVVIAVLIKLYAYYWGDTLATD